VPGRAAPFEIENVGVRVVGVGVGQRESPVVPTPRFCVGSEMDLRLLGHPGRSLNAATNSVFRLRGAPAR
jgi:hypothetical protein